MPKKYKNITIGEWHKYHLKYRDCKVCPMREIGLNCPDFDGLTEIKLEREIRKDRSK